MAAGQKNRLGNKVKPHAICQTSQYRHPASAAAPEERTPKNAERHSIYARNCQVHQSTAQKLAPWTGVKTGQQLEGRFPKNEADNDEKNKHCDARQYPIQQSVNRSVTHCRRSGYQASCFGHEFISRGEQVCRLPLRTHSRARASAKRYGKRYEPPTRCFLLAITVEFFTVKRKGGREELALFLLGAPRIERLGKPVEVDTRKAIALFAYLALEGGRHSRDELAALLYPEYDETHARASLRRTLSSLRQALGENALETDRETIALNPGARLWVDVTEFQKQLNSCREHAHAEGDECADCLEVLEEAAGLYRGDLMAGFSLRDSPNFDDWQFFQAENLRRDLITALSILVCCHSEHGEYDRAISYTRRWLALDPLDEPAHRQLMRLLSWTGQRTAALRQYRELVRLLDKDLGVAPLEETTRLHEAIEESRELRPVAVPRPSLHPAPPLPPLPVGPSPAAQYPLVGRSQELAALTKHYDTVRSSGYFAVLEGEAGMGKTRLAEEFLGRARERGAAAITARCYEGEANLAYGPFVEGLRALDLPARARSWVDEIPPAALGEAARLLPELARYVPNLPPAAPMDSPGAQTRFFDGISQLLLSACGGRLPCILFIDDLQWADPASVELLTFLVRRLRSRPLFILATWRGEELPSDDRLRQLLAEAERAGTGSLLRLPPLSRSAVAELVQATRGADQKLADRLYRESEGRPFFLIQYLALLASGEKEGSAEWSLPRGVRGLLRSHVNRVSETARQLLSAAAVIGRSFDFEILREASGRNEVETVGALEELIRQGLVVELPGSAEGGELVHDFQHEKLREFVYQEMSLTRRRLLHRRVAEALANRGRARKQTGALANRIAAHYQAAGQEGEAAEYYRLAGDHARSLYANAEALGYYRSALALGYGDTAALHEAIGDLQTLAGEYGAALRSYETAAAFRDGEETAALEAKLANVYLRRGEWDLAENHFQAALAALGDGAPPETCARIYGDWSLAALRSGRGAQALELGTRALELAKEAGDQQALAQAHNILGILERTAGNPEAALAHLEQSEALAQARGDGAARSAALNNLALVARDRGDLARGIQLAETALALSAATGDRHREAALHNNLADLLHEAGRAEEAMDHLREAVKIYAEIGVEAGMWQPEIWKLTEW